MLLLAAEEAAGHATSPVAVKLVPLVTTLIVFGAAFWVLAKYVWPRITAGLDERDRKIRDEIKAAEEAREQANAALKEYEASLAEARQEATQMIAKARADAKAAAEELRNRNEAELNEMKQRARREIDAARQQAIAELHGEAVTLATSVASRILQRELTAADQQALVESSLQELAAARSN